MARKSSSSLQISVTFRHVQHDQPLRDYAIEKLGRAASKYLHKAERAHVILSMENRQYRAEINLHASHLEVSAHASADDPYPAIDAVVDRLEAQLRKHKDKLDDRKHSPPGEASTGSGPVRSDV